MARLVSLNPKPYPSTTLLRRIITSLPLNPNFPTNPKPQNPIFPFLSPPTATIHTRRTTPIPPITADKPVLLHGLEAALGSPLSPSPVSPPPGPLIVVVSGPSGVGKDSVIKKLRMSLKEIHFVITATTRARREGEVEGEDYDFVSKEEFMKMVEGDELLEYAVVYGEYKGIPRRRIREAVSEGRDVVLRVDIQGAATLRRVLGDSAVFVFVAAESEAALVERLVRRGTGTTETLLVRVATAREEVKHMDQFDYVVVNAEGKLDEAVGLVGSIIDAEKARVRQRTVRI